jgi:hypothetical protein
MRTTASPDELQRRTARVRSTLVGLAFLAAFFVVVAILLLDTAIGLNGVHLAGAARDLLGQAGPLPSGQPYAVDRGLGGVARFLATALQASTLVATGSIVWALIKRRKAVAYAAIGWIALIAYAGPIPTMMQPMPPVAVSVPVARSLLHLRGPASPAWLGEKTGWRRYMLAQIAYTEGDRAMARRLAAALSPVDLQSPIEGDYRLALLGGQETASSACFKFGCLTHQGQRWGEIIAASLALTALVLTGASAFTLATMRRRRTRIDGLVASHRLARLAT